MRNDTRRFVASAVFVVCAVPAALIAQAGVGGPPRGAVDVLACAPQAVVLPPAPAMRIIGGQEDKRALFGSGDAVIISGGSAQGVRIGQEFFVRRVVNDTFALPLSGFTPISIRTAGWIRVVEVEKELAIATITHACDGILASDYVEAFVRPVEPAPLPAGEADYTNTGLLILGDDRQQIGAAGTLMILDRGSAHGVRPGQRLTIFRDTLQGAGPVNRVGNATAVVVRTDTSVVRIDTSRDAVYVGDRVALHR